MSDALQYIDITLQDSHARICTRGAVVTEWVVPSRSGDFNLIDGYASDSELLEGNGARSALLAPWSNRVRAARFTWNADTVSLPAGPSGKLEALHGLVTDIDFQVDVHEEDYLSLSAVVSNEFFPVPFELRADYTLSEAEGVYELNLTLTATNLGSDPAPLGLGWHPYIRYEGAQSEAELIVEAKTRVEVDAELIPLDGESAFTDLAGLEPSDSMAFISELNQVWLGSLTALDTAFTDLTVEETNGTVGATLFHGSGARTDIVATSTAGFSRGVGVLHFFTGEPLQHRPGQALAMEFCQFMTNAFNRSECLPAMVVEPGRKQEMSVSLLHAADPDSLDSFNAEADLYTTSFPFLEAEENI